jgi:hypothetical protein
MGGMEHVSGRNTCTVKRVKGIQNEGNQMMVAGYFEMQFTKIFSAMSTVCANMLTS